jgi:hypothetical protein
MHTSVSWSVHPQSVQQASKAGQVIEAHVEPKPPFHPKQSSGGRSEHVRSGIQQAWVGQEMESHVLPEPWGTPP